ncbi:leucine--tRNA ligase [Pelagicoccus enzymogenes]|uniref:leucine--tRNA ligase n=1 Tax=Pelagicoccus enzymogenes TaxID=2773457 RepID=UPI00281033C0|nr:leucine--tRNA ligase [Pelagicoccus enzymogenes]MDQ8200406.1 leucine--tRNA ligase [Pelagicoccus enzymogenes]
MSTKSSDYNFSEIESTWQQYWEENKTFAASNESDKEKYFVLDMFPYPSGAGLHIGHPLGYTGSDILARYKRAQGKNVLHPIGWDAFGLATEQYAIKTGKHPRTTSVERIGHFRKQLKTIGFSFDYDREVDTTDPKYYRWTQWIFLQLFKRGLAYVDMRPVWWCDELKTVLANEEVIDGKSERGNHPVVRRNLRQVVLKITEYADRLIEDLDLVDWPASTKKMQQEWIGKSTGATARFALEGLDESLEIYTTRPDTLMGVTYMVVSPEHPLLDKLTIAEKKDEVAAYVTAAAAKSDLERTDLAKEKSGVFTGSYAVHPITGDKIPVWVADYVLISYGTGAIMAVPAHDTRDFEFAQQFNLPITQVIKGSDEDTLPYTGDGVLVNSGEFDGLPWQEAKEKITAKLKAEGTGEESTQYKLRDWLFSRQRYWGEPFPIAWVSKEDYVKAVASGVLADWLPEEPVTYTDETGTVFALPVPPSALPLELPYVESYEPAGTGESPLKKADDWMEIWYNYATGAFVPASGEKPEGEEWVRASRETNTMPQWAGSCWYYLRYMDPHNEDALASPEALAYWETPDMYVGGAEHAVLHLLYARFWHKVLYDAGVVKNKEPFRKLFHQGMLLGEDGKKISKSAGNGVDPVSVVNEYGADTMRMYLMFLGPLEARKPWNSKGIGGISRFLNKVWREIVGKDGELNPKIKDGHQDSKETEKLLHETIKKVSEDLDALSFNTAISQLMILINHLQSQETVSLATAKAFVQMVAPMAPHIGEELWSRLGEKNSVGFGPWPKFDEKKLVSDEVNIAFQVMGKTRGQATVSKTATQDEVLAVAQADPKVAAHLEGKTIRKVIYVPGRILNIVAN